MGSRGPRGGYKISLETSSEEPDSCALQPCEGAASYGADYHPEIRLCNHHYNLLVAGRRLSWKRLEPEWRPPSAPAPCGDLAEAHRKTSCALCRPALVPIAPDRDIGGPVEVPLVDGAPLLVFAIVFALLFFLLIVFFL